MERTGELRKLIAIHVSTLARYSSSWSSFVCHLHPRQCLAPGVKDLPHAAAELLDTIRTDGIPVPLSTPDWDNDRLDRSAERGSHPSTKEYLAFLESDMADMVQKGFWVVLPYESVCHLPGLRISPMGVVPQQEPALASLSTNLSTMSMTRQSSWGPKKLCNSAVPSTECCLPYTEPTQPLAQCIC